MQINELKKISLNKTHEFIRQLRTKLSCFASVTVRALCPFESRVLREYDEKKEKIKQSIFYLLISFILGLSPVDVGMLPFGLAILCCGNPESTLFFFCGAEISSLFEGVGGLIQFITFFLVFLLRKLLTEGKFNEGLAVRMITAFCSSAFIGACGVFTSGFSGKALFSYLAYITLCVVCVFLFSPLFLQGKSEISGGMYLLSVYSLCVCMLPAFNRFSHPGVDLSLIFSCVISLWFCRSKGPVYGCISGFLLGFGTTNPLFCAPLGISCLVSAFLMTRNFFAAVLVFPVCSFFVYVYLFGIAHISSFLPFTVAGSLLYLAFYKYFPVLTVYKASSVQNDTKAPRQKNTEFEKVSDSLSGLSSILYKFAEHVKAPSVLETGEIIDNAFGEVCDVCSMNSMCYAKRECNMKAAKNKIVSILHAKQLCEEELSLLLLGKCIRTKELCSYINLHYSELYFITMKSNRTQTVASMYNSMSRLIRSATKQEQDKNIRDSELEKKLCEVLGRIGVEFSHITVSGRRCKEILVHKVRADKIPCSSKQLSDYLSDECKIRLSEPVFDISDSADLIMKFTRDDILSIDYAQCCEAKKNESVNGDTVCFFENDKGFFYCVIADGMGSGKQAAATSRLSCAFLEKMLSAGSAKSVCIEMLNNLLLAKNDETFSGIDLLEIDKLTGNAYFIKAGAAASFVLRHSRLYKISSETPPVGIIPSFSAESTRFTLEKGDTIIMVSDGVMESDADAVWLSGLIGPDEENEPAFLAKKLLEKSGQINGRHDDASVCVLKIY